ncbi:MAG: 16S rRNA (uracil(1498)-N(3))-methyltransferase [Elusimicrobiaceae bacterium]|nr:16S rRNA (uracil(1498)-N(3))-methyltransferase [Elusimicrobiaceae bacterium]MBR5609250.1 16S rRNA (uracil(1498)-N(3))-methyltransferase [Elusimicrobiaceae bacterium]
MPQYLADIKEKEFFIENEEAHHLTVVARRNEGDEIVVFDGKGKQFKARITRVQKKFVRGTLLSPIEIKKSALSVELCFAPTSRNTLEDVLDKCTQLGVTSFQPIYTTRSEYDLLKKWDGKEDRWHQIILSACKQCSRGEVPVLHAPVSFEKCAAQPEQPSLLAYEAEETHTLAWGLEKLENPKQVRIYIGPAGGWTDEEVVMAAHYGILPVTLGPHILRAETACISACAKLL